MKWLTILTIMILSVMAPARASAESSEKPSEAALSALEEWEVHRDPGDFVLFLRHRRASAERVAKALGADPDELHDAWRSAPLEHQVAILSAVAQVGNNYRYASSDPDVGFDCSGLTRYVWEQTGQVSDIPTSSRQQLSELDPVEEGTELPGDIWGYPGHVMLWLGVDNYIVHAANSKTGVALGEAHRDVSQVRPASARPELPPASKAQVETARPRSGPKPRP